MNNSIPPDIEPILKKLLGDSYFLPLQPHQISTLMARTTGHILSYEQNQWIYEKTEGFFPPLYWVIEVLKKLPVLPRNPQEIKESLEKKAFPYFKELLNTKIPPHSYIDLLTLSIFPGEIDPRIPNLPYSPKNIFLLIDSLKDTPWFIQVSPKVWRFHPLFQEFLQKRAREELPQHEDICLNLIKTLIANEYPLEAEELLTALTLNQPTNQGSLLFSLGEAFTKKGHKEKALTVYGQAVLAFGHMEDSKGITDCLNAMGTLFLELGRKEEAEALYQQLKEEFPPEKIHETFIPTYLTLSIPKLHIRCLGEFIIERGGKPLNWEKWKRRKSLSIFQYLLLQSSHRATKEELLELFWPEEPPEKASNSYHVTIHALRQSLTAGLDEEISYLGVERGVIYLIPELISFIDIVEFHKAYREGLSIWNSELNQGLSYFWRAKELYQGILLEGMRYEEWLFPIRENLHFQYIHVLTRLALHYTQQGDGATGLGLWQEILRNDPTNEEAAYHAMTILQTFNRRNEALSIYKKLVLQLKKELDTTPEDQIVALYQRLSRSESL